MKSLLALLALLAAMAAPSPAAEYGKVTSTQVADGVYLFTTTRYGDVGFCGNVVAIVSGDGVALFDSGGTPAIAREILRQLRSYTSQPVRYLVNSHWHWDHWGGNQVIREAFPAVQIIAHDKTREQMINVGVAWNAPGLARDLPNYIAGLRKKAADAEAQHSPDAARLRDLLRADEDFLAQKRSVTYTFPQTTFSDTLTLRLGEREIQVRHARAITASDTYVYLPKEKILITGDLDVAPIPFAVGGTYPTDWMAALRSLIAGQPALVLPGHGDAQHDTSYLQSSLKLFQTVHDDVAAAKEKGLTLEQTEQELSSKAKDYAALLGLGEDSVGTFKGYFLEVFIRRAYRELEHPLGDEPTS